MVTINVIDDRICGSVGDVPFSVKFTTELYNKLSELADKANNAETIEEYQHFLNVFQTNTVEDLNSLIQDKCDFIYVNEHSGEFFLKHNGVVSSVPMPEALVERIYESMDKGIDFLPLVKMWTRWLRNPILRMKMKVGMGEEFSERFFNFVNLEYVHPVLFKKYTEEMGFSDEKAIEAATMYQMKITKEGLLNGYKVSREILHKYDPETGEVHDRYKRTFNVDTGEIESEGLPEFVEDRLFEPAVMGNSGDAFYCEGANGYGTPGHFIKVGCVHRLDSWDKVNTNDYVSCVPGLHFGGLKYISGYGGEIHNVFVDPMHIGAIPDDETGAVRCLQYFVHSSLAGVNGSIYHSSTYAAMTDAEWDKMREEAVALSMEKAKKLQEEQDELNSL